MEKFEVNILGCGAAIPIGRHMTTSQVVNVYDKLFMVDCGEGTQTQIWKSGIKLTNMDNIFISHAHGDHFFGLVPLLSSLNLMLGRTKDINVFVPEDLKDILMLRPIKKGDILGFERIDGVFKKFYKKAIGLPSEHSYSGGAYVFIIDEINRGDLSKIFGELFYAIDPGYRGEKGKVKTQYQNLINKDDVFADGLFVPENVYILATMNDIDRSVESMDFALRRRFAWKEIKPEDRSEMLSEKLDHDTCEKAARVMTNLNKAITKTRGLGSAYQIGPAYFLKLDKERYNGDFTALWDMHIEILLKEYLRGYSNADAKVEDLKKIYFDSLNGTTIDDADQ